MKIPLPDLFKSLTRPTRYKELGYVHWSSDWRIVDLSTGNAVGPWYHTKAELMGDLTRYATVFGCDRTK